MQEAIVEGVQIMLAAATAILKKSAREVEPRGHGGGLLMLERIQDNLPRDDSVRRPRFHRKLPLTSSVW
jgi:hypothetical protein